MPLDPFTLSLAIVFTAGCGLIHALRSHADDVTLVLCVLAYGLTAAVGSLATAWSGLIQLSDPIANWAMLSAGGI